MTNPDADRIGTSAQMLDDRRIADLSRALWSAIESGNVNSPLLIHRWLTSALNRTAASQDARPGADAVALALNAARVEIVRQHDKCGADEQAVVYFDDILLKIDAALAAPQPQAGASEPVAWRWKCPDEALGWLYGICEPVPEFEAEPLYATPSPTAAGRE